MFAKSAVRNNVLPLSVLEDLHQSFFAVLALM
jgi:hypothetical protein